MGRELCQCEPSSGASGEALGSQGEGERSLAAVSLVPFTSAPELILSHFLRNRAQTSFRLSLLPQDETCGTDSLLSSEGKAEAQRGQELTLHHTTHPAPGPPVLLPAGSPLTFLPASGRLGVPLTSLSTLG